jgi:hypothetical protein
VDSSVIDGSGCFSGGITFGHFVVEICRDIGCLARISIVPSV